MLPCCVEFCLRSIILVFHENSKEEEVLLGQGFLPIRVRRGEEELEVDNAKVAAKFHVLETSEFVGNVGTSDVDFQSSHSDCFVDMIKEVMENVEYGSFRHDQFLEIFWMEIVSIHVNGREEDGFHLIVTKFVSGLMGGNQNLKYRE